MTLFLNKKNVRYPALYKFDLLAKPEQYKQVGIFATMPF